MVNSIMLSQATMSDLEFLAKVYNDETIKNSGLNTEIDVIGQREIQLTLDYFFDDKLRERNWTFG